MPFSTRAASRRIRQMMPDQQTVTLLTRITEDTFSSGVLWQAQTLPRTESLDTQTTFSATRMAQYWRLFQDGQTVMPTPGDRIVDSYGVRWEIIGSVAYRMGRNIYDVDTIRDV